MTNIITGYEYDLNIKLSILSVWQVQISYFSNLFFKPFFIMYNFLAKSLSDDIDETMNSKFDPISYSKKSILISMQRYLSLSFSALTLLYLESEY